MNVPHPDSLAAQLRALGLLEFDGIRKDADRDCPHCRGSGRVDYDGDEYPPGTMACICRGVSTARAGLVDGGADDEDCNGAQEPSAPWVLLLDVSCDRDPHCDGCGGQPTGGYVCEPCLQHYAATGTLDGAPVDLDQDCDGAGDRS